MLMHLGCIVRVGWADSLQRMSQLRVPPFIVKVTSVHKGVEDLQVRTIDVQEVGVEFSWRCHLTTDSVIYYCYSIPLSYKFLVALSSIRVFCHLFTKMTPSAPREEFHLLHLKK